MWPIVHSSEDSKLLNRHTVHDTAVFFFLFFSGADAAVSVPVSLPLLNVFSLCFVFQVEGWHCPFFSSSLPCCPCSASLRTIHLPVMTVLSCTQVFVSDTMSPVVSTKQCGCSSTMDAVCACRLLIWCMFACIFICVGFIWQQNDKKWQQNVQMYSCWCVLLL